MGLLPAHRSQGSPLLPDLADLWNSLVPGAVPGFGAHLLRVEDTVEEGNYIVRAEIPGIDPAKDVEVSVHDGRLTIKAERAEKHEEKGRSEFSYGSFVRSVTLPPGAQEEGIAAAYNRGVLTVTVPMGESKSEAKRVEVTSGE